MFHSGTSMASSGEGNRSSTASGTEYVSPVPGQLSMLAEPNTSSTDTAELLWKLASFGFSLLSPNDQQHKIEQFSEHLAAGVADVKRLEGETEEDLRRKKFAELFNKAPVLIFPAFTKIFSLERELCDAILLFRQLDSNEQQEWIEKMLNQFIAVIQQNFILERLSEESEEDFRLRRFIKLCYRNNVLLDNFIRDEAKDWDLKSLHMQKSGKEEIEIIKQSCYAGFYLGSASSWFNAQWASDPKGLIDLFISKVGEGDHIIEKLVNETEEDFRLRRFTESFKQLQFSSMEEFLDLIKSVEDDDPRLQKEPLLMCRLSKRRVVAVRQSAKRKRYSAKRERPWKEYKKVKTPNLEGSGAVATQGGGQGASQQ